MSQFQDGLYDDEDVASELELPLTNQRGLNDDFVEGNDDASFGGGAFAGSVTQPVNSQQHQQQLHQQQQMQYMQQQQMQHQQFLQQQQEQMQQHGKIFSFFCLSRGSRKAKAP